MYYLILALLYLIDVVAPLILIFCGYVTASERMLFIGQTWYGINLAVTFLTTISMAVYLRVLTLQARNLYSRVVTQKDLEGVNIPTDIQLAKIRYVAYFIITFLSVVCLIYTKQYIFCLIYILLNTGSRSMAYAYNKVVTKLNRSFAEYRALVAIKE